MSEPIPDIDPVPTVTFETGDAGAMKLTMSISDGTHVWMAIDAESWSTFKAKGDAIMAETLRLSEG